MIKIFPVSLHHLLAINDLIQQFSTETDGLRTCHGCGKKASSLQRYAKCALFWYCDKVSPNQRVSVKERIWMRTWPR
ncbi:hypothetical protein K432DRAFT_192669 [Lepidopterella palustris CBS 459.81]|uniref:Uncharacterized protein n=1 Tax=Lepidopterella palustris CBS 459.81 TaxID=1314670 RepID=A0A8E2JHV9_9PEZI|nr:hypothetical protein K432DRAFT_192669 [Lepidopterella palustris CBS 459.81]